jgi:hypothetical protein
MRLPLAVGFSVALSLSLQVLQSRVEVSYMRGAWVGLTCAVIMDMSVPERILVRAVLRAFGSIVGAILGVVLVLIYEKIGTQKDSELVSVGQYIFQLLAIVSIAFICSVSVKLFKDFTYAFLLVLFTVAIALYPPSLEVAIDWMCSVCLGVSIAGISLAVFHYPSAAQTVLDCNVEVLTSCVDFVAISIGIVPSHREAGHAKVVHNLTHKLAVSHEALHNYVRVHKYIRGHQDTVQNLEKLSVALRGVYHRSHSVYLTLRCYSDTTDLFADEKFCEIFGYHILRLKEIFLAIKEKLSAVHRRKTAFNELEFTDVIHDLEISKNIMYTLKSLYLKNQSEAPQHTTRWSVLCILLTMAPVISALTEYMIALAHFMRPYAHDGFTAGVDTRLSKVKAHIDHFQTDDKDPLPI